MRYVVLGLLALTALACGTERRGNGIIVVGDCVEGATNACTCTDGRPGSQQCLDKKYQACVCDGIVRDAGLSTDAGELDAGSTPRDAGSNGEDSGTRDTGPNPRDAGPNPRDAGPNPRDAGPNPRDAGPNPRDAGPRPRDGGPRPPRDAGLPPTDGGTIEGGPCLVDADCNAGLPFPLMICEQNICEFGCLFLSNCPVGTTCDLFTGRCL